MVYSFQEEMDEFEPSGEYEYLFHHVGDEDETRTVEGDTTQEAYRNLHHQVGAEWNEWVCLGRKDIVEYKMEINDNAESPLDARCSTTGMHPVDFASANEDTVERWEEEDEE